MTRFTSSPTERAFGLLLMAMSVFILACDVLADDTTDNAGWRQLDPKLLVQLTTDEGTALIELNPLFAPAHVKQFRTLVRKGFYDGESFYRVIEGFVAQGGDGSDMSESENTIPALKAELELELDRIRQLTTVQVKDMFAAETAFADGFAVGLDRKANSAWLIHCPGAVAMARGNDIDSGSTDFYIVIGQAPRYLDRNLTVFGRVVTGMDVVQKIRRGPSQENGMITEYATAIKRMRMVSDLPESEQPDLWVTDTAHENFAEVLKNRRHRTHEFFHVTPPAVLDVCQVPLQVRSD